MVDRAPLLALLDAANSRGGLQTDDVLTLIRPLLAQVAALHAGDRVAAFDGERAFVLDDDANLGLLRPEGMAPVSNLAKVDSIQAPVTTALRVIGTGRLTNEADTGVTFDDLTVSEASREKPLERPAYLPGYVAWEHAVGHHDAASDILVLGEVLASLACGLDFTSIDDVRRFAANRENLFRLNPRLHPVIASVIVEMTELERPRRTQELGAAIQRLDTYRDQPRRLTLDPALLGQDSISGKRRAVQARLRDRLFDLSRRNRLLHFRPSNSSVNLTVASVPLVIDLKSIKPERLCVWRDAFPRAVLSGEKVPLGQWLRFEDQPYLPGTIDLIIQEARRNRAEFGFSQLSLVVAFLRWHNLKEDKEERILSPLLLLPVNVSRKKGVRDQYILEAETTEAEVNPVLRHQLHSLYGIELPDSVDLRETTLESVHAHLQAQITATEPGVELRLKAEPQIELIHQRATQRLEQFRRRQAGRMAAPAPARAVDYSYAPDDFRPLGLALFDERVRIQPLTLRDAVGGPPGARPPHMAPDAAERTTYSLHESRGNPYVWDFDLTTVTLGNFNYRKMSLVRDYNALVDTDVPNAAFDRVFSLAPRTLDGETPPPLPISERWAVVTADATQTAAVSLARTGASYIIQGPPGTGKSQTITNLVADHVGTGKRVLFVCEKRAAIDVVFHRLRQQGLDELCCIIHDSQADKKAFVMNLKQTYEHWSTTSDELDDLERRRKTLVKSMRQDLEALERFDTIMRAAPEPLGTTVRALVRRIIDLRGHEVALDAVRREALPDYTEWLRHSDFVGRLERTLREAVAVDSLAAHVFARLSDRLIRHDRPLARLAELTDEAESLLDQASERLAGAWPAAPSLTWRDLGALAAQSKLIGTIARKGHVPLLVESSDLSLQLENAITDLAKQARAHAAAAAKNTNWLDRLAPMDAIAALEEANSTERSLLRFLKPSWWRLRKTVNARYDFAKHATRPRFSVVLGELVAEHRAQAALDESRAAIADRYGATDPESFTDELRAARAAAVAARNIADFHRDLLGAPDARAAADHLAALAGTLLALGPVLDELLTGYAGLDLDAIGETVRDLRENADLLPEVQPLLLEMTDADPTIARTLRTLPLSAAALEYVVASENLERIYRQERWLPRFDARVLARHASRIAEADKELLDRNAQAMRARVQRRFRTNLQRSQLAASQLDADGKLFKKSYSAGRRELEHEFGKSMRFKSIRELASGNSGQVVRDMKPVWLMSPLSVSDTLPLAADLFDVVIFDEASQIPVEEAVPALYRAPQVIVVGDEMQLPPTDFFTSARGDDEDTLEVEDEGERFSVALDADSLLHQGARNLPATLLSWHYRSRSECLIGFSNAAFYAGNLYTIPDRTINAAGSGDINVQEPDVGDGDGDDGDGRGGSASYCDALLGRPVSFHFMQHSPYSNRRNEGEARHIAQLVRELLARETGHSIGIVAFSEAQQTQIESALSRLADQDAGFSTRLDAEMSREEDDQFCGLFVKNLENVQGDERDIIILSICYGPDPDGKMLMNFGPINQRGGEKRLNVIFSRARHHMAVVSSIRHEHITNDNNTGAAALKNFLRYAEHLSGGRSQAAQQVLQNLNPMTRNTFAHGASDDVVVRDVARALRERGHTVDEQVGQSRFRCDLAVREPGKPEYALGILIDTDAHYENRDLFERYVSRPRILSAFKWNIVHVLSRDWLHEPEGVLRRIERALRQSGQPIDEAEEDIAPDTIAPTPAEVGSGPIPAASVAEPVATREAEVRSSDRDAAHDPPANLRRFEFTGGESRKFWHIGRAGTKVTIAWGRLGTRGQMQIKQFSDEARADAELGKLIAEKLRKGYVEKS
jgi:predicted DNA-binding WGR domain protein